MVKSYDILGVKRNGITLGKPSLVGADRKSGGVALHQCTEKGGGDRWIAKRIVEDIADRGYEGANIILKCDQERALVEIQKEVAKLRGATAQTVLVNSPVGESQSNGEVDNAVGRLKGLVRIIKSHLEH